MVEIKSPIILVQRDKAVKLPAQLAATRYVLRPPTADAAIYLIIVDHVVEGKTRPVEIFIQSRDMESFQWITFVTRIVSALLRMREFPEFILEEFMAIHDPKGGYTVASQYMPSVVAHIGHVIKQHCVGLGLISAGSGSAVGGAGGAGSAVGAACPSCKEYTFIMESGCQRCTSCGYSKC